MVLLKGVNMIDKYGRDIYYLRLSVTDLCNLRCRYCMPGEGVGKRRHEDMLTEDEMIQAVSAAAALGITKVRITGGEPLVKKNILSICRRVSEIPGIQEVALTTNGIRLSEMARPLLEAGVQRLNISLDTLNPEKYRYITRIGNFEEIWKGFLTALDTGFKKIKINAVLLGGFNDDEIISLAELTRIYPVDVRFIEWMPMYDSGDFNETAMVPGKRVLSQLDGIVPVAPDGGVADLYRLPGALGNIGLITPVSSHFCDECSRIRLSADGKLKPCLHWGDELNIKGLDDVGMQDQFKKAIGEKPFRHGELSVEKRSMAGRLMNQIGG